MKRLKKGISLLLCVLLLCAMIPLTALNAGAAVTSGNCGKNGDNVTWSFDSQTGVFTLSGSGEMTDYASANSSLTYNIRRDITSIVIEDGITYIGNYTFYDCTGITSVTLPNSVTELGYQAFYACNSLETVTFGSNLTTIGSRAFSACSMLKSVTIPDTVTQIGTYAFCNCSHLSDFTFGAGVTQIKEGTLQYCSGLKSVTFSNKITSVVSGALSSSAEVYFDGTYSEYQRLGLSNTVHTMTAGGKTGQVFWGLYDGMTLRIYGVGAMADYSEFLYDEEENEYDWVYRDKPWDSLKQSIQKVEIAQGVTNIGNASFRGGYTAITSLTIADSVQIIGREAFSSCSGITSVSVPDSVKTISSYAFEWCSAMKTLKLGTGVEDIYGYAFSNCRNLQTINYSYDFYASTFPGSLKRIYSFAFAGCSSLGNVVVPKNVTRLGYSVFNGFKGSNLCIQNPNCDIDQDTYGPKLCPTSVHLCCEKNSRVWDYAERNGFTSYGHNTLYGSDEAWIAATCTEPGQVRCHCLLCNTYFFKETPALGHNFGEWQTTKEATCTEDGEEHRICSRCEEEETRVIEALGHDLTEVDRDDATCEEDGTIYYWCSRCKKYLTEDIPAPGHEYNAVVTPATCTEGGYTTHTCSHCGDIYVDEETDALGHDYDAVVTPATCTEGGYTTHTCSRCGDSYVDDEVDALGHDYEVSVLKDPTAAKTGRLGVTCTRCDFSKFVIIPILSEKDYTISDNTATCTEGGTATFTWKDTTYGTYSATAPTDALGHDYVESLIEDGKRLFTCSHCGDSYIVEPTYLGDTDGDGEITMMDVTFIQRVLANLGLPDTITYNETAADVDGDGEVTVSDVTWIQRMLAHMDIPYDIGGEMNG